MFVGDTPVEKIIPAMRKYCEYAVPDDFENAMDIAYGAYYRGYSWEEIAWALEPAWGYGLAMPLTAEKSSNYFSKNTRHGPETRMSPRRLGIRVSNQGF